MTVPASMESQPALHGAIGAATGIPADVALALSHPRIPRGLPPRALGRVREHIDGNLEKNISIEALASIAGLSLSRFARAFKQSQGVAPHEYLMQCRVRRALELLAATDMSVSEIACASGFSDQSHLTRR